MSRHYKPADLTPHPVLARIVPPLGEHEREALFASLDAEGQLTPVLVSNRDGKLYVLDGLNRIAWASDRQDDRGNVRAVAGTVLEGLTEEREVEIGLSMNGGRRHLTTEQRREMVRATLREYPGWSDRKIASACGVSAPMVGDHRKQLVATGEVKESYTRTGRDGVTQPARKPRATGRRKDKPAIAAARAAQDPPSAMFPDPPEHTEDTDPENDIDVGVHASEGDMAEGASTNGKGRIKAPEGMTLAQAVREAMHHDGSAAEIAAAYGWSAETYSRMRYLMLLADRDDLPEAERTTVAQCVDRLNTERVIGRIWPEFEPIVNRIYGDAGSRRTHPDKVEANRLTAFERAYGALIQACRYAPDIDVPHLPAERATEIVAELKQAEQSVRTLRRKIEGATR